MKLEDYQLRRLAQIEEVLSDVAKALGEKAKNPYAEVEEFDRLYIRYKNLEQHWNALFDSFPK